MFIVMADYIYLLFALLFVFSRFNEIKSRTVYGNQLLNQRLQNSQDHDSFEMEPVFQSRYPQPKLIYNYKRPFKYSYNDLYGFPLKRKYYRTLKSPYEAIDEPRYQRMYNDFDNMPNVYELERDNQEYEYENNAYPNQKAYMNPKQRYQHANTKDLREQENYGLFKHNVENNKKGLLETLSNVSNNNLKQNEADKSNENQLNNISEEVGNSLKSPDNNEDKTKRNSIEQEKDNPESEDAQSIDINSQNDVNKFNDEADFDTELKDVPESFKSVKSSNDINFSDLTLDERDNNLRGKRQNLLTELKKLQAYKHQSAESNKDNEDINMSNF